MILALLAACSSPPLSPVVPSPTPEPAVPAVVIYLKGESVVVDMAGLAAARFGIAETGAHEAGWFGEDCATQHVCHVIAKGSTTLGQVHHLEEVEAGHTLFDNHFGGSLTYFVESGGQCWVSVDADKHFADRKCTDLQVDERVEELVAGQVEPTHWKDPNIPKHAASPSAHRDAEKVERSHSPTPAHLEAIRKHRQQHSPAIKHCCKTCRKGTPCGNTCISRSRTCHTIGGCAC